MVALLLELDTLNSTSSRWSIAKDDPGLLSIVTSATKVQVIVKKLDKIKSNCERKDFLREFLPLRLDE
jgi:hypothetical protein